MTIIGGSRRYAMLPDRLLKKKQKQKIPFWRALLHALPEWGFELGYKSSSREVEQEGVLWLHCRTTCTRDSLKFKLLGTFEEYRESCSAGKVLDSGSHRFIIRSGKSCLLKLATNMEHGASSCQMYLTPNWFMGEVCCSCPVGPD